jgi:dTDP-4-dehydrorhamnose reductase
VTRVVVTGAGGQVGRALLAAAPAGLDIVAFGHKDLDITDAAAVKGLSADVIINAAAYTAVDKAESDREVARAINVDGVRNLAATGARLIQISTDFVFDGQTSTPYKPDSEPKPLSVYGATKRGGELLARKGVVLRTAWVYAADGNNFVRTMLRVMKANGAVRVVADQVGTPTSARSLAEVLWKITANPEISGIHHWTDAGVASWYDFAVAIAEEGALLGLVSPDVKVTPIATHEYPTPARRPAYSVLDKSSLTSKGFKQQHWRQELRAVLKEIAGA